MPARVRIQEPSIPFSTALAAADAAVLDDPRKGGVHHESHRRVSRETQ